MYGSTSALPHLSVRGITNFSSSNMWRHLQCSQVSCTSTRLLSCRAMCGLQSPSSSSIVCSGPYDFYMLISLYSIHQQKEVVSLFAKLNSRHYPMILHVSPFGTHPSAGPRDNMYFCHAKGSLPSRTTLSRYRRYPKTARWSFWSKHNLEEQGAFSNTPRSRRA